MMDTKQCTKCLLIKPLTEFGKQKTAKDGLRHVCKPCNRDAAAAYKEENREEINNRAKIDRKRNPVKYRLSRRRQRNKARRTWKGFFRNCWNGLNRRTINGGNPRWDLPNCAKYLRRNIRLEMTYAQVKHLCWENRELIEGIYRDGDFPSIDRREHGDYTVDNTRIIPMRANSLRGAHGPKIHLENQIRGEQCSFAKMNDESVRAMRAEHAAGATIASLARKYGIADTTTASIVKRKRWKHVL